MKKTIMLGLFIFLTAYSFIGVQSASASTRERTDEEIKAVATELYERMDKERPELIDAFASYNGGKYLNFLKILRNRVMDQMYEKPNEPWPWFNIGSQSDWATEFADLLVGRTTLDKVKAKFAGFSMANRAVMEWGIIGDPAIPIKPNFMAVTSLNDSGYLRFGEFHNLAGAYWKKGDEAYLRKWEQIWEAYSDYYFIQGRELAKNTPPQRTMDVSMLIIDYNHASVLSASWRVDSVLKQMSLIIKSLPGTAERETNFMKVFRAMDGKLLPESYDMMDPVSMAKIILCLERDHFEHAFQFYIAQTHTKVANQTFGGLTAMATIIRTADWFTSIDKMRNELDKAILTFFMDDVHKDGAIMEQSLNYTTGTAEESKLLQYYARESKRSNPDLKKIDARLIYTEKLHNSIATPFGRLPNLGGGYPVNPSRYWEDEKLLEKDFKAYKEGYKLHFPIPYEFKHFTSIAFPYAGYYVLRSGWDKDDTYLFTQNARRSLGHMYVSNNEIQLISKRRDLVMSGGITPYGINDLPEDVRGEARSWIAYFGEDANMSRSTIAVDGLPQARGTRITVPFVPNLSEVKGGVATSVKDFSAIQSKWSDSDTFAYHEGLYEQGFIASQDVSHYREFIMIKPLDLVLVSDIMGMPKGKSHDISQVWCFPPYLDKVNSGFNNTILSVPGFKENEVSYDADNRLLKTQDPTGPNVFLKNFSNYSVDFKKYFGYKKEGGYYLGWYSPAIRGYKFPKVDMHINYKANESTTPLVTAISSSYTLEEVVTDYENLSNDQYSGFKGVADGKSITYLSARTPVEMKAEDITLTAKTLVKMRDADTIKGIATECSSLSYKGKEIKVDYYSFEFEIIGENFNVIKSIEKPSSFRWLNYEDGSKPVYNMLPEEKVMQKVDAMNSYAQRMTTTRYSLRGYTIENIKKATDYALQNVETILMSSSEYAQMQLINAYMDYVKAAQKEIGTWNNSQGKTVAINSLYRLKAEIENVAETANLDSGTRDDLETILKLFDEE